MVNPSIHQVFWQNQNCAWSLETTGICVSAAALFCTVVPNEDSLAFSRHCQHTDSALFLSFRLSIANPSKQQEQNPAFRHWTINNDRECLIASSHTFNAIIIPSLFSTINKPSNNPRTADQSLLYLAYFKVHSSAICGFTVVATTCSPAKTRVSANARSMHVLDTTISMQSTMEHALFPCLAHQ